MLNLFQKLKLMMRSPDAERNLVARAGTSVMSYLGLHGRCTCMGTKDEFGINGFLLTVETDSRITPRLKVIMERYFQRKLKAMIHIAPDRIRMVVYDLDDIHLMGERKHISTQRLLNELQQANPSVEDRSAAAVVQKMRLELQQAREAKRFSASSFVVPVTDLAELPNTPDTIPGEEQNSIP